ncbi:MAG: glycosyltransferase family 2 protein [Candidatus Cloacimonetes bacterium]|nr:glycosyltransferase family 2 protein [Candidatus Cloacimonadota bacterium]
MNMHGGKISVVIPVYNREKRIRYCLDSVLNQTYSTLDIIVVDDCSTDKTVQVIKSYSDPRIRCIVLDKNSGAQAARNRGIKEAKGEWIAFLDSDDEWMPEKLEKQIMILKKENFNPWVVVHSNCLRYYPSKGEKKLWKLREIEGDNVYPLLLKNSSPMFQGLLVSKMALEKIGYLDENVPSFQEWDTSLQLAKYCKFFHIKEPLFIYYRHEDKAIFRNKKTNIEGQEYILHKFENDIKNICGEKVWERHLIGQLKNRLNYKFWNEFDEFLIRNPIINNYKYKIFYLKICRFLHIKPSNLIERIVKFMVKKALLLSPSRS